jgi:hypothetical protein
MLLPHAGVLPVEGGPRAGADHGFGARAGVDARAALAALVVFLEPMVFNNHVN